MFSPLVLTTRPLGRYLLAAPLALALTLSGLAAQAQVAPTPAPAMKPAPTDIAYYVDGQPVSEAETAKLDPQAIANIGVVKSAQQLQALGRSTAAGAVLITTKANADAPAVLAFNKQFPKTPATPEQTAAMAAVQAYMVKTYPNAKLQIVGPDKQRADHYRAFFEQNGQRMQLLFDANGQPVKE
ncbi:hypothetical protein [Hymenobacter psoromatis]|uniref:hypothetical protein n=1 Tax=Hymenobacter psoromatis TaxID=1484116 RepID=UPI001CBF8C28|nr:hypothetical protein [Hymenobacter psoromatis]